MICDSCGYPVEYRDMYCQKCYPDGLTLFKGVSKEIHDKVKGEIAALRTELADLRQWKSDVEDTHRQVMDEKCQSDEQHCTCVPVLRREIASLTLTAEGISEQCKILNGTLARYREALNIAEMLIDFIPEGWGMPFGYGVVVTQFKEAVRLLEADIDNSQIK